MTRYTISEARERLAAVLDAAEAGEAVFIERRGVRFTVTADRPASKKPRRTASLIETIDDAVSSGNWTWASSAKGVTFAKRRTRS